MQNTLTRPSFPFVVNSSLLSAYRSCPRKAYLSSFEHWRSDNSVHLVAGRAFAAGLECTRNEFFFNKASAEDAIALGIRALWLEYGTFPVPDDSDKSPIRMAGALEFYFFEYPLGADGAPPHRFPGGKHGIEFSFTEPLDVLHPVTGDPILYCGRADLVADAFGGLFLFDEKTTSRLGKQWLDQWDHRSQFTAYCWGLRSAGYKPAGVVVRGVSILANGYGTAQAITYRSDWEIARWKEQTERDVRRMIENWREGYWDYNLDHACGEYGGCGFRRVCKSPDPDKWLRVYFKQIVYDPMARTETPLVVV